MIIYSICSKPLPRQTYKLVNISHILNMQAYIVRTVLTFIMCTTTVYISNTLYFISLCVFYVFYIVFSITAHSILHIFNLLLVPIIILI